MVYKSSKFSAVSFILSFTATLAPLLGFIIASTEARLPTRAKMLTYIFTPVAIIHHDKSLSKTRRQITPRIISKSTSDYTNSQPSKAISINNYEWLDSTPSSVMHDESVFTNKLPNAAPSASAPLNLDSSIIRSANEASKSDTRKMAERSGAYFGDNQSSEAELLANGIAQSAKPDCFSPDRHGSLISIFAIAYMAAKNKCK